jgi:hypothetical protein
MQTVALALSLSLSLVEQMWERENKVAVSAFRAPPPFYYPIFENLNDFLGFIIVGGN